MIHWHFISRFSRTLFLLSLLLIAGCSSKHDEQYFRSAARKIREDIELELKGIHSLQDAKNRAERLQSLFAALSDLMVEIDLFQEKEKRSWDMSLEERKSSQALLSQMERLFALPGVRAEIEKAQEKGFKRLETYFYMKRKRAEESAQAADHLRK